MIYLTATYEYFKKYGLYIFGIFLYSFLVFLIGISPIVSMEGIGKRKIFFFFIYTLWLLLSVFWFFWKKKEWLRKEWVTVINFFVIATAGVFFLHLYILNDFLHNSLLNEFFILKNQIPFLYRDMDCWSLVSKRLLTPYLSNLFYFRSEYALYFFQKILQGLLFYNILYILKANFPSRWTRSVLFISMITTSAVSVFNHWIMYPDVMSYLIFTTLIAYKINSIGRIMLYIAALLNHELALFILPGIIYFVGKRNGNLIFECLTGVMISASYIIVAFGMFNVVNNRASCTLVDKKSYEALYNQIYFTFFSMFTSIKFMWVLWFCVFFLIVKQKIMVSQLIPQLLIFIGVIIIVVNASDLTRFFGLINIGILILYYNKAFIGFIESAQWIKLLLLANVIYPSYNCWYNQREIFIDKLPGWNHLFWNFIGR